MDKSHLNALELALSHERQRLKESTSKEEREIREVWVMQLEREVEGERKFLGLTEGTEQITDEELLKMLLE